MKLEINTLKDLNDQIEAHKNDENITYEIEVESPFNQEFLERLASSLVGKEMTQLTCRPEYENDIPIVDFTKVFLPKLESLDLLCQGIKSLDFTTKNTPLLDFLNIEQPSEGSLKYINLDLPNLSTLELQFVDFYDARGFGKSISRCPKIEAIVFYKVNGLYVTKSKKHKLVLPLCGTIDLHRCEDLNYLDIWAPKLSILKFQACYGLDEVNILDQKPSGYSSPEYHFNGEPKKYKLMRLNTEKPKGNAFHHSRCKAVFPKSNNIENHRFVDPLEWINYFDDSDNSDSDSWEDCSVDEEDIENH